mgnify:CR=1 FL=1
MQQTSSTLEGLNLHFLSWFIEIAVLDVYIIDQFGRVIKSECQHLMSRREFFKNVSSGNALNLFWKCLSWPAIRHAWSHDGQNSKRNIIFFFIVCHLPIDNIFIENFLLLKINLLLIIIVAISQVIRSCNYSWVIKSISVIVIYLNYNVLPFKSEICLDTQ